ncbi:unnamed protein product, partial [Cyprideis torosa]
MVEVRRNEFGMETWMGVKLEAPTRASPPYCLDCRHMKQVLSRKQRHGITMYPSFREKRYRMLLLDQVGYVCHEGDLEKLRKESPDAQPAISINSIEDLPSLTGVPLPPIPQTLLQGIGGLGGVDGIPQIPQIPPPKLVSVIRFPPKKVKALTDAEIVARNEAIIERQKAALEFLQRTTGQDRRNDMVIQDLEDPEKEAWETTETRVRNERNPGRIVGSCQRDATIVAIEGCHNMEIFNPNNRYPRAIV